MKILGNEIKPGMIIEHKNDLWSVLKAQHVKPGKGGAFNQVELKIKNTDATIKGQTASSSYKPATLENGIKIMVQPFINNDDKIILSPEFIKGGTIILIPFSSVAGL